MLTVSDGGARPVPFNPERAGPPSARSEAGSEGTPREPSTADLVRTATVASPVEAGRALARLDRENGGRAVTDRQVQAGPAAFLPDAGNPTGAAHLGPTTPSLPPLSMNIANILPAVIDGGLRAASRIAPVAGQAVDGAGEIGHALVNAGGTVASAPGTLIEAGGRALQEAADAVAPAADAIDPRLGGAVRAAGDGAAAVGEAGGVVRDGIRQVAGVAADVVQAAGDVGEAIVVAGGEIAGAVSERGVRNVAADIADVTRTQFDRIGQAWSVHAGDPGGFVDWLTGPEGPSVEDWTATVPGLQEGIGNVIDAAMENPLISGAVGRAFSFEYVPGEGPEGGFYTTNEGSIQSMFGFHDFYDKVGKALGMDLDDRVMHFEDANGVEYRVELWKGGYGNGGAFGGEIGIYTRGTGERGFLGDLLENIPGYYSSANGESQIPMTQEVYNKRTGEVYIRNDGAGADDGEHYWNLAIRTDPGVRHEDLGQRGTLVMDDPVAARNLATAMREEGIDATVGPDGRTVTFEWE